ncbi:hypothetical protein [Paenibacillus kobensis]|uniref:hypothetical protein n=1 Tax=Paenibacillus kobensis TaxID=59841 RepID=UPI001FE76ECE|nr:hypothetical protein [Paenibacillus kobensis]
MAAAPNQVRVSLSRPEVTYFNLIKFSVGDDPLVRVDPLRELPSGAFLVALHVKGSRKRRRLRI